MQVDTVWEIQHRPDLMFPFVVVARFTNGRHYVAGAFPTVNQAEQALCAIAQEEARQAGNKLVIQ